MQIYIICYEIGPNAYLVINEKYQQMHENLPIRKYFQMKLI